MLPKVTERLLTTWDLFFVSDFCPVAGSYEHGNKPCGFIKGGVADLPSSSQEWLFAIGFVSFFPEGGVGLVPKRGCLLTLAYYVFPRCNEFGQRRWNNKLTGESRRTRRKTCPSTTLSTTNPTWIDPGANPGLRSEMPATNDLSHGTVHCVC
jgi:hypothetical protein